MPKKMGSGSEGVIFTRAPKPLIKALDKRVRAERDAHPERAISRSDVVREILWRELAPKG